MNAPQGAFYWNGVQALLSASYSLQLGMTPGVATLVIPPQPNGLKLDGTLTIRFGPTKIDLPNCRIVKFDFHRDASGRQYWLLHIADERWRWRYGCVNGYYNHRLTNGFLEAASAKKPHDLAEVLAKAIGIQLDWSTLPNKTYPFIDWEWKDRPDTILASLCGRFGCAVAYNPGKKPRVVRLGFGNPIPKTNAIDHQIAIDPTEIPEKIVFVAGRSQWNVDIPLEAVGEDFDGRIRPIDKLSFTPADGWGFQAPPFFQGLLMDTPFGKLLDVYQRLAQRCVYRWYRPKMPFKVGEYTAKRLWQILPLPGYQLIPTDNLGVVSEFVTDNFLSYPCWFYGNYNPLHESNLPTFINLTGNLVTALPGIITSGVAVDSERGIFMFPSPMFLIDEAGKRQPAKLWARCAVGFRDPNTRQFVHWTKEKKMPNGSKGTQPYYMVREELGFRAGRDISTGQLNGDKWTNEKALDAMADHYIDQLEHELKTQTPEVVTLPGFHNIQVDGAIQQVRWWVTESGEPFTMVARNTESQPIGGSFMERRYFEKIMRLEHDGAGEAERHPI